MDINRRIAVLEKLGIYMRGSTESWEEAKDLAVRQNSWFISEYIELAVENIVANFLQPDLLQSWMAGYNITEDPKTVGIVMAGNIPLVGFHDFLCGFLSGHNLKLKLSAKDSTLLNTIIAQMALWEPGITDQIEVAEMLKGCDAYIATGSNNTSRYFEQYFAKFPHLIRRNRTSVAVLDGTETQEELQLLAQDVFTYFGMGCRNVTQLCVPKGYTFDGLLKVFDSHESLMMHHKYHNNYDFHLAVYLLNAVPCLTNGSVLIVPNDIPFSAVSVLHYRTYTNKELLIAELQQSQDMQALIGHELMPFGSSQKPSLSDYADGVDTMQFLCSL